MAMPANDLQRLLAEEPFVRALARSLVKGEADDVVQQAYLLALQQRPSVLQRPRAWLASIVRNLAADQRRRVRRRDARQRAAAVPERVPSSSELLEGEERRRELITAVDALPGELRTVVLLRYYDGQPPRRIAAELGVPVAVVWNRLHGALQLLRKRLDAAHRGERRAWLVPLVPFATAPRGLPWRELLTAPAVPLFWGAMVMTTTKVTAAVAVLVLAAAWALWPGGAPASVEARDAAANDSASLVKAEPPESPLPEYTQHREVVATANNQRATTGNLVVNVRYADEPQEAPGVTVAIAQSGSDFRVGVRRAVTDSSGHARFDGLPPGKLFAWTDQNHAGVRAEVQAGLTTECSLRVEQGMNLTGVVIDADAVPVAGALIEVGSPGISLRDVEPVAVTATDGSFVVRSCIPTCVVGARAPGHAASRLYFVRGERGATERVRIELLHPGGSVAGVVLGPDGRPVQDAVVRVGEGRTDAIESSLRGAEPLPAQVRTAADGRFLAVGVPPGTQPLMVRAAGLAPWRGTCEVMAGATAAAQVCLTHGVTCLGVVRTEAGQPAGGVSVSSGSIGDFLQYFARTGDDGRFELAGLPSGDSVVSASERRLGKASTRVHGEAGATVRCELVLSNGLALRGQVLDEAGKPIANVDLICEAEGGGARWGHAALIDEEGRFLISECPIGRLLVLRLSASGFVTLERTGVDPSAGELDLRLQRDTSARVRVSGRIVGPDGQVPDKVTVQVVRYRPQQFVSAQVREGDGSFAVEVQAGEWLVEVLSSAHPHVWFGPKALQAGERWDLGTIELVRGGRLVVRGENAAQLEYWILDANERYIDSVDTRVEPPSSELLRPGEYLLLACGAAVRSQALPFAVKADQPTELQLRTAPGVRQVIEFVRPVGAAELPGRVAFELRRDGRLMAWNTARRRAEGPLAGEVWLAPGSYSLATREREPRTTATFTVGEAESPPFRIELR